MMTLMPIARWRRSWIILALLVWLGFVLATFPARWLAGSLGSRVGADGVDGTLWQGRADNVMLAHNDGYIALGTVQWQVLPWTSLRHGALCLDIESALAGQQLAGRVCSRGMRRVDLSNLDIGIPAAGMLKPGGLALAGDLLLRVPALRLDNGRLAMLEGRGSWHEAAIHDGRRWIGLGTLGLDLGLDENAGTPRIDVFSVDGPAETSLQIHLAPDGRFRLHGEVILKPDAPDPLRQVLAYVAHQRQGSRFFLDL